MLELNGNINFYFSIYVALLIEKMKYQLISVNNMYLRSNSLLGLLKKRVGLSWLQIRKITKQEALLPEMDLKVKDDIESERIKPRKHPGVLKQPTCSLPEDIVKTVKILTEDHTIKHLLDDAKVLTNYLYSRHYPWEEEDLRERVASFKENVKSRMPPLPDDFTDDQAHHYNNLVKASVANLMSKYNYRWSPLDLQEYSSMVYLMARSAPNYAAVMRVFREIAMLHPDYKPVNLFDFGAGIGSVSWAAKAYWGDSLKEFVNIDSSNSMNELSSLIIRGGNPEIEVPLNVYYRSFLPSQHRKYSIVVSAHSLLELPSRDARLNTLLNLWHKTQDFLVIVEQGTKPGFKVIVEARDFILSLANEKTPAHVVAPCPHEEGCPRYLRGPYPCHYQVKYFDLQVGKKEEIKKELLSYVIIKKGERQPGPESEWPRVVRPVLQRHNHVICRLCTPHGDLREIIFTKSKHGKVLYKCAKVTSWGDRLPVKLSPVDTETETQESGDDET
ncbi:methyltransferase-like protein 17, mitochondrial [Macrosteles quadrilineatus]|uniref:methyltransferase-like protein 17, mitochondrial n=1 Tax=Macrosteles quadrilineatus TaxID=74068 RepID=UPI0023E158D1|nr:methyltransferase-like protein 17, mitochondrial [Macrosteles quadrilineatus]